MSCVQIKFATMGKTPQKIKPVLIRRRLAELKHRLKQVANAWTVDDYEAVLDFYVRILPKIMKAERCTIYIIEMGTDKICSMFGTGIRKEQIQPPRKGSIAGEVISTGKGTIKNDLETSPGYHTQMDAKTGFVTINSLCYPIKSLTGHGVTGAIQVLNKKGGPFIPQDMVQLEAVADYLSISIESIILNQEILRISNQLNKEYERFDKGYLIDTPFIADSPVMQEVIDEVESVSDIPVNVLIQGENGTGKELIARMIHESGDRRDGSFVAVNCSAIPENLMESEFFGYEKGAFTGAAQRRKGRFEEADGGTLFLDEIADMPLSIQPKFLRVVQEREGSRLGSNKLIRYNLRIICATNKDLRTEIKKGNFREDLFFRLFSVAIRLPSLSERKDACPDEFPIGVVKIFTFPRSKSGIFDLSLNEIIRRRKRNVFLRTAIEPPCSFTNSGAASRTGSVASPVKCKAHFTGARSCSSSIPGFYATASDSWIWPVPKEGASSALAVDVIIL